MAKPRPILAGEVGKPASSNDPSLDLQLKGQTGDGEIALSACQLHEHSQAVPRARDQRFHQQLVGPASRCVQALEEVRGGDLATTVAALQHEPRVERQCAGWQFSRRVRQGDAATKGTAIAYGEVGNMRHGFRDQRQVLVDDRRIGDLDVASERADADVPVCQTYALQRVEFG